MNLKGKGFDLLIKSYLGVSLFYLATERILKPSEMNCIPAAKVDEMQVLRKSTLN